jgi:hypothetical protein
VEKRQLPGFFGDGLGKLDALGGVDPVEGRKFGRRHPRPYAIHVAGYEAERERRPIITAPHKNLERYYLELGGSLVRFSALGKLLVIFR